jgi:lactoylglutathione lyase
VKVDPRLPIRSIDYTVVVVRQMGAMRRFYGDTLGFPLHKELGPQWVEFRIGSNLLALRGRSAVFDDPVPPVGVPSLQLAFRVRISHD